MKFIPILFSTDMVQALLQDRKSMTRRTKGLEKVNANPDEIEVKPIPRCIGNESDWGKFYYENLEGETILINCPYGKVGDVLWVRESFRIVQLNGVDVLFYEYKSGSKLDKKGWKPSIHMPKAACRLFLEITDIRIERLQDISEDDAKSEGIKWVGNDMHFGGEFYPGEFFENYTNQGYTYLRPVESFKSLWAKINGINSWDANPWVWVISFQRRSRPLNFL